MKIRVEEIRTPDELYQSCTKVLHLHLHSGETHKDLSQKLLTLFTRFPGPSPILFHVNHDDREIIFRSDAQYTVSLEEPFMLELNHILGENRYTIEIKN